MKEIIGQLFPPDVKPVQRWRLMMFSAVVMLLGHVAWACGWLQWANIGGGFAYASDLKHVSGQVVSIKIDLLEAALFDTRTRQCNATATESKRFYTEKVQELLRKYSEAAGKDYRLPGCDEL